MLISNLSEDVYVT